MVNFFLNLSADEAGYGQWDMRVSLQWEALPRQGETIFIAGSDGLDVDTVQHWIKEDRSGIHVNASGNTIMDLADVLLACPEECRFEIIPKEREYINQFIDLLKSRSDKPGIDFESLIKRLDD